APNQPPPQSGAIMQQRNAQGYLHTPVAQPSYQHQGMPPHPQHGGPLGTSPMNPVMGGVRRVTGPMQTSFMAQGTRVDLNDQARQIGTQIAAVEKGFLAFERIASDLGQLRADYERLRLSHELSREIALERDTNKLLEKILASVFKFIQ